MKVLSIIKKPMKLFQFLNKRGREYEGEVVSLKLKAHYSKEETYDHVESVVYDIYLNENHAKIGSIDLRLTMNDMMFYYGSVGYHILEKYRGHSYAYEACLLIMDIAKTEYLQKELIFTCNPDNYASKRTIEKLMPVYKGCYRVPYGHPLRDIGEYEKEVYVKYL